MRQARKSTVTAKPKKALPAKKTVGKTPKASAETKGLKKQYLKNKSVCKVTFRMPAEVNAENVCIVGEFNNWDHTATPMKKMKNGDFMVALELDPGKEYRYRYYVNNCEWHNDWCADRYEPNEFGQDNSVVIV